LARYLPPILRRGPGGGSPGSLILIAVIVLIALIAYGGEGSPGAIFTAARDLAFLFPALILSLSVHELAHAWVANSLGDDTARLQGRLTLDPRSHLDPLGTFMLILTVIIGFGIGWAKPVPVNPWKLKIGPRIGMAVVSIAGPISNIVIAFAAVQAAQALQLPEIPRDVVGLLVTLAGLNIGLAVFNMLPLPPLDGYRVLLGLLPGPAADSFSRIEPYGPMILLFVVFMGGGFIGRIIGAVARPLMAAMVSV
jgi:Zn-dependent protease